MKKLEFGILVIGICLVIGIWSLGFIIGGCGQGAKEAGVGGGAFNFISSRSPGLFVTGVSSGEDLTITFTNPIATTEPAVDLKDITGDLFIIFPCHTASTPIAVTNEIIWSPDMRTATFTLESWGNPNGRVQIYNMVTLIDSKGNHLPPLTRLWEYNLAGAPTTYSISGTVTRGSGGTIYVFVSTDPTFTDYNQYVAAESGSGNSYNYKLTGLPVGTYYVGAIRDVNDTGFMAFEPDVDYWGTYEAGVPVSSNVTGINFAVYRLGEFSISGQVSGGDPTKQAGVGVFTEESFTTMPLTWEVIGPGNPLNYTLVGLNNGTYYVGGYRDTDGSGANGPPTSTDLWGNYLSTTTVEAITIEGSSVTGKNFVFDYPMP